ncbi:8-oxoguanine glycosylase ogg1 [Chamberlinius hualienensis]
MAKLVKRVLACEIGELRLDLTLPAGQSFRWKKINEFEWRGVFARRIWTLSQKTESLEYSVYPNSDVEEEEQLLRDYFQLDTKLTDLYKVWEKADKNFAQISSKFSGVRVLRQDPVETVFSFICSSNNNISRITSMVEKLCSSYGDLIGEIDGVVYHQFPNPEKLAHVEVERHLKEQKFGYRASFIHKTAKIIKEKGDDWLYNLRKVDYPQAHQALLELSGVGAKVADCVCLMALDKTQAIPVDTHIFQIAAKTYLPSLKSRKSLTDKTYKEIGDYLREMFGSHAGWAQSVLFSSDLAMFKDLVSDGDKKPSGKRVKRGC